MGNGIIRASPLDHFRMAVMALSAESIEEGSGAKLAHTGSIGTARLQGERCYHEEVEFSQSVSRRGHDLYCTCFSSDTSSPFMIDARDDVYLRQ